MKRPKGVWPWFAAFSSIVLHVHCLNLASAGDPEFRQAPQHRHRSIHHNGRQRRKPHWELQPSPQQVQEHWRRVGVSTPRVDVAQLQNEEFTPATFDLPKASFASTSAGDIPTTMRKPSDSIAKYCAKQKKAKVIGPSDTVEVQWGRHKLWYAATVTEKNVNDTFDVRFHDGRVEAAVNASKIRKASKLQVGQVVEVRWKGYSAWYVAELTATNADGTFNVFFKDDGVREKDVPLKWIKVHRPKVDPNDAVCKLADTVGKLQHEIASTDEQVKTFVSRQTGAVSNAVQNLGPPKFSEPEELIAEQEARKKLIQAIEMPTGRDEGATGVAESGPAPAPAHAPAPAITKPPEEWLQMIKDLREQLLARTSELVGRAKALGAFEWQLEELVDLQSADNARLQTKLPTNSADAWAEIKRLEDAIADRADRLAIELDVEDALARDSTALRPTDHDAHKLVDSLKEKRKQMKDTLNDVLQREQEIEEHGDLDPELRHALETAIKDVGATVTGINKATLAAERGPSRHGGATQPPPELSECLFEVSKVLTTTKDNLDHLGEDVVPNPVKFWRFRWEYSFAEALVICLLCLLASAWQIFVDVFRASLISLIPQTAGFVEDYLPHLVIATWFRNLRGELVVLLFVMVTLHVFVEVGVFKLWLYVQFTCEPTINMPEDVNTYVKLAWTCTMQFVISVVLFNGLTLSVCFRAMQNQQDCQRLEENRREELQTKPVSLQMIGKKASSPESYAAFKKGWLEGVAARASSLASRDGHGHCDAQDVRFALDERNVISDNNYNAFPLWFFIGQRVRIGVEKTISINAGTWLCCFLTFLCFAILHGFFHVAYIRISCALAMVSIGVFLFMAWTVNSMSSRSDPVEDSWTVRAVSPFVVVSLFQFPLFFLCFVTTRLVVSVWMWMYFFWVASLFTAILVAFMVAFPLWIAPMIILYLTTTCFPPHTDGSAQLIRDVMEEHECAKVRNDLRSSYAFVYTPRSGIRDASSDVIL